GFAHEVNTPVGIAVGAASQLRDAANETKRMLGSEEVEAEELEEVLEIIIEGTDLTLTNLHRAAELIQRFKRSSIDRSSEVVRHFRVREVIEDVLTSLQSILKKTQVNVIIECPDELHIISVPGLIEQVLVNLIQNSLLHGFNNGAASGEIHISCCTRDSFHLVYEDNGKGMSAESAARIFEPFYTTERGSNSGLGMYISYNLVHHHHGTLYCESTPGQGVWFSLDLPIGTMADLEKTALEN
ncbi:MAG: sensor histidine kinase, partial [Candidatus Electrothrix sp. EH2]|nr:sensor histidine kinase [Candidatus Electrothrix sp. EH2]